MEQFTGTLRKGIQEGAWTYVIWPDSAELFGTRSYVKIRCTIDGHPHEGSLMPLGDGTHMMPVRAEVRELIGKDDGDKIDVALVERL